MSFCTLLFLTVFLPAALAIHWVIPKVSARNLVLLLASLLFYAAGEHVYVFVLVGLACANYWLGLWVSDKKTKRSRLIAVTVGVAANIAVLAGFKYVDFAIETANSALAALNVPQVATPGIHSPIGISFITFQPELCGGFAIPGVSGRSRGEGWFPRTR